MLLHIFNMIWAQRRTNGWIFAELVLAVCALWILADQVWVDVRCYQAPMGYDISNTWRFKLSALPAETTDEAEGDESSDPATDLLALMERIRQEAEVEEVAMCYWSMPYSYGNSWRGLFPLEGDTSGVHTETFHVLQVSPEYFDLFRMRDEQGQSITGQVKAEATPVVLSGAAAERFYPNRSAVGMKVSYNEDGSDPGRVVAVVPHFRSNDFDREETCSFVILQGELFEEYVNAFGAISSELCVRMKREMSEEQMFDFLVRASERLQYKNLYVSGVKSLAKQRGELLKSKFDSNQQRVALGSFLLLNVFFGVAGTFWLRTQRRRGEIGLRLAMGSSHRQIGQVIYSEGLLLLALTLPFLLLFALNYGKADQLDTYREAYSWLRFAVTVGGAYILMAMMIVIGICYPVHKAESLPPAEALRYE
ncbi:MAG: ABC transporter permease [Parabacteroides sp.]